ncbi:MAG: hypothetical protein NTZ36_00780 [Candidatus Jorgensenbacteria bacterium]|nr:hypothetical protein [Candidatus Jorgensenbacteria bacterium]
MRGRFYSLIEATDWSSIIAALATGVGILWVFAQFSAHNVHVGEIVDIGVFVSFCGSATCGYTKEEKSELSAMLSFSIPLFVLLLIARWNGTLLGEFGARIAYSAIIATTLTSIFGAKFGSVLYRILN